MARIGSLKESTLHILEPLLRVLRTYEVLEEVRPASFHLDGRDFLHFHDEPSGLVADVRLSRERIRHAVGNPAQQSELLERIEPYLERLEAAGRKQGSYRKGHRR